MSRNSSGTYTQPGGTTAVAGATIDPTTFNTLISDLGNELTNSLDRGGRGALTADMNAGGFRVTNAATPTGSTDLATKGYIDGSYMPKSGGTFTGATVHTYITVQRQDSVSEGGEILLSRASDNGAGIYLDCFGSGTAPDFRVINSSGSVMVTVNGSSGAISTGGQIESSGTGFKFPDGTTQTTAAVAYSQPTTVGAIGTYAFLNNQTGGSVTTGASVAGASLNYGDSSGGYSGVASGTWRCMGVASPNYATLFLRIS